MQTVIIDGWAILRHGFGVVVRRSRPGTSITEAGSAVEGLAACRDRDPSVVLAGHVDDAGTAELVGRLRRVCPDAKLVVLVDATDAAVLQSLLTAGADAILCRTTEADDLADAMERVGRGERVLSSELVGVLAEVAAAGEPADLDLAAGAGGLTRREREIVHRLARGATNREIAVALYIGEATVKSHLGRIYDKLGVSNRHQAVARAFELGILGAQPLTVG